MDKLDLKDYDLGNNRCYRYVLALIDNFSIFGWTVRLKNKKGQTMKNFFENILIRSTKSPHLIATDREKDILNKIFTDFLKKNIDRRYSRKISLGAVFIANFNHTIRDILEKVGSKF